MKTEIAIDGITYKVGDVLELYNDNTNHLQKIVYIGHDLFMTEYRMEGTGILQNSIISHSTIRHWKIKKPKKKIVVEFWVALTRFGTYSIWSKYEFIPTHRDIVKTENLKFEYEVDND
jgi:hypothetical protein